MEPITASSTPSRPEEELQYIRKIIADSRARFAQSGEPYIIWGLIIAIGMGLSYLSLILRHDLYTGYIWPALILFGWGSMIYLYRKRRKEEPRAKSIIERIDSAIWGTCGGTLGLGLILILDQSNLSGGNVPPIYPLYTCFFASMILGIAYYLTGVVNDLRWLRNIGFAWWAGAIVMYLWPTVHVLGIYAGMLILFQVIPGIILQRRYRRIVASSSMEA